MNTLRWIVLLPAAIVAYLLTYNVLILGDILRIKITGASDTGWWTVYFMPIIATLLGAFSFMIAGISVAPNNKEKATKGLLILGCIFSIAILFGVIYTKQYFDLTKVVALGIGIYMGYKNKDDFL